MQDIHKSGPSTKRNKEELNREPITQRYAEKDKKRERLTHAQANILQILINKRLYQQMSLDSTLFKSDLVIKMEVPRINYLSRKQKMELGSILRKFPKQIYKAYQASYSQLYADMEDVGDDVKKEAQNDKELQIRELAYFRPFDSGSADFRNDQLNIEEETESKGFFTKNVPVDSNLQDDEEFVNINCSEEASGILDSFTITYNTLIYSLQQFCGFQVRSFLVSYQQIPNAQEKLQLKQIKVKGDLKQILKNNFYHKRIIYILLYLPDQNMIKAANKYHIKKQIDYPQIDSYLNQPMDSANRPLRYHSAIQHRLEEATLAQEEADRKKHEDMESQASLELGTEIAFRKTIDRKIGLSLLDEMKGKAIINQVNMSDREIQKYLKFHDELGSKLEALVEEYSQKELTINEKNYLLLINRGKLNKGVEKLYLKMKMRRKYFEIIKQMCQKKGYRVFDQPLIYTHFKLANKTRKFFARFEQMLIYKETTVSPDGQLAFFNKMERIKLSYLILKEYIRVENMYMLSAEVFALSDSYEKFGKIGDANSRKFHYHNKPTKLQNEDLQLRRNQPMGRQKKKLRGGLNGRNLDQDWSKILVFQTNFNTMRNYLGQSKTFQVFIKTNLIKLFFILAPMGIIFQIVKFLIIKPNNQSVGYLPQFWFYLAYMIIVTIAYGIFIQIYRKAQINYIDNFVEENPNLEFIHQYRGPYMRDNTNDNANTYDDKFVKLADQIKRYLIFIIFFLILGVEIGFYYGIRTVTTEFSYIIQSYVQQQFQLYRPVQLIGYSIFFCINYVLYNVFITPFAHWITKFENRPTKDTYVSSENLKLFIFGIGIQLIGPIDLVYIQYAAKTSCQSNWCANQLEAYVYCRYIIILFFTIAETLRVLFSFACRNKIIKADVDDSPMTYSKKLSQFLQFIHEESNRQPCADIKLVDETVSLIQFATFLTVFPLGPTISFLSMLFDYNLERLEILKTQQRPIPKSEGFHAYRKIVVAIGHWMLFFNFSQMFIVLEWLEYLFQKLVLALANPLSPYGLMTVKYATIIAFMIAFECLMKITESMVKKFHSIIDNRKWNMLQKKSLKFFNERVNIELNQGRPLHSISRTYNIQMKRNAADENIQSQINEPNSIQSLKNSDQKRKPKK